MATARDFINLSAKEAGILGVGQTLLAEDINDCFTLFTRMLNQWQVRRWLVPGLTDIKAVGNYNKSNLIGPGQYYNAAITPDKILAAYFIQLNTGNQNPVSYPLEPIWSYEDYARLTLKTLQTFPQFFFYDNAFPNGNVYIWPIPGPNYEIHLITKLPLTPNTSIETGSISAGGTLYTDGQYEGVALTGGSGTGATADIQVTAGVVVNVIIDNPGLGYILGDILSATAASIGGTGSGFTYTVTETTTTLDTEIILPPEYDEAIHYNLALRIISMYNLPTNPSTSGLAKIALNTIKNANAQVPTLVVPSAYGNNNLGGFNIWAPDVRP